MIALGGPDAVPPGLDGPITGAANSVLSGGILGALVLLFGIALVIVVMKWNKANESRVKDQKEMAETLVNLTDGIKDALRDMNGTTDALKNAVTANTAALAQMERTLNETVRDAVRAQGYRRMSPMGGTPVPKGGE